MIEDEGDNVVYMWGKEAAEDGGTKFTINDTVNIPRGEYDELLSDSMLLGALVISGVERWDGYDDAVSMFDKWNEEVEVANDT